MIVPPTPDAGFSQLERDELEFMLTGDDPVLAELRAQLPHVTGVSREFTGVGFFTEPEFDGSVELKNSSGAPKGTPTPTRCQMKTLSRGTSRNASRYGGSRQSFHGGFRNDSALSGVPAGLPTYDGDGRASPLGARGSRLPRVPLGPPRRPADDDPFSLRKLAQSDRRPR